MESAGCLCSIPEKSYPNSLLRSNCRCSLVLVQLYWNLLTSAFAELYCFWCCWCWCCRCWCGWCCCSFLLLLLLFQMLPLVLPLLLLLSLVLLGVFYFFFFFQSYSIISYHWQCVRGSHISDQNVTGRCHTMTLIIKTRFSTFDFHRVIRHTKKTEPLVPGAMTTVL